MFRVIKCLVFLLALSPSVLFGVELTIYDDGRSCPSGCDSHVVFHSSTNGTVFAHKLGSVPPNFETCILDTKCEICFEEEPNQCLVTMYRGSGPGRNTFDLTPAFYEKWCKKEGIPKLLSSKCAELKRTASKLDGRINCIKNQNHELCATMMQAVIKAKEDDTPIYQQCLELGQRKFNKDKPDNKKRKHNCAYEFESNGGPNSSGLKWHKLLPAACRENTFVGRDGLDCCSGSKFVDAALGIECRIYYLTAE